MLTISSMTLMRQRLLSLEVWFKGLMGLSCSYSKLVICFLSLLNICALCHALHCHPAVFIAFFILHLLRLRLCLLSLVLLVDRAEEGAPPYAGEVLQ